MIFALNLQLLQGLFNPHGTCKQTDRRLMERVEKHLPGPLASSRAASIEVGGIKRRIGSTMIEREPRLSGR